MPYTLTPAAPWDVDVDDVDYLKNRPEAGDRWVLNFGPQHPATHTTLRVVLELDGERVVRATPHIGYLHSGFEKLGEHQSWNQFVCVASRTDYVGPICNDIIWHNAVEKLFDIELTPRCKVLRTILMELGRIQGHLLCVGAAALDLGAFTGFLYGFNEREFIYDIIDFLTGQRFHPDYTRVGGVVRDIPDEDIFKKMIHHFLDVRLPKAITDIETLLNRNRIFIDRVKGVGILTAEEATNWSLTGPLARASGVARDLRKDDPNLCYADNWDGDGADAVEFDVPIAQDGDCLCRYLVRLEEMKQSSRIIKQLIDHIPAGPINVDPEGKAVLPPKSDVYGSIEGTIQQFELIMSNRGLEAPIGEVYAAMEAPNGEYGFFIVSGGGRTPWRVSVRAPSFINYQTFARMLEGHQLADFVAILGSINVIAAELDR
ncbi:MAG: NADH-quinone oxidoreductase subunit D [Phycisphaerales bacterium]|jgi:NADH-quinone oxidoreductase subunit D|nr:NADH-quinone oxidoreductase subunit D [Phycisphaerales bacterium]MDP7189832.1 NADH-quinone oxidoreductase subunit D [Phycisphaerales bacterium]HJN79342.1 NADH-quinone oxidoreductase subunit D [Phycisphaerales bacterium]